MLPKSTAPLEHFWRPSALIWCERLHFIIYHAIYSHFKDILIAEWFECVKYARMEPHILLIFIGGRGKLEEGARSKRDQPHLLEAKLRLCIPSYIYGM